MPSPFPGMDPYIDGDSWQSFHTRFVTALGDALVAQVRPRYVVDVEQYVYLAREPKEPHKVIGPDVAVAESEEAWGAAAAYSPGGAATAVALQPVVRTPPVPRRRRQHHLAIRRSRGERVVTVIELLSPWNKDPSDGQPQYLVKRQSIFATPAHLVELELLRGGQRLPTVEPLPAADYYAFVCRRPRLPKVDVYSWALRDRLPAIPVPLAEGDPDVVVDLQSVFAGTYDRAGYDYALKYRAPVEPALPEADAAWAREVLGSRGRPGA